MENNKKDSWEYDPSILFTHIPSIIKNLQNQGIPIDPIWQKCFSNDYKVFFNLNKALYLSWHSL